jgi:hypothetical protein
VNIFRGVVAVALTVFDRWCLSWLALFALVALIATNNNPLTDYLLLAAWVSVSFVGAYLIQPFSPPPRSALAGRSRWSSSRWAQALSAALKVLTTPESGRRVESIGTAFAVPRHSGTCRDSTDNATACSPGYPTFIGAPRLPEGVFICPIATDALLADAIPRGLFVALPATDDVSFERATSMTRPEINATEQIRTKIGPKSLGHAH